MPSNKKQFGFGMIEVVIGLSIILSAVLGLFVVSQISLRILTDNTKIIRASYLLDEGMEAVKIMRDSGWVNISSSGTYFLDWTGTTWATSTNNVFVDGVFERKFTIANVNRDANDDITTSGGTLDPNTKKVTVYVSWRLNNATTTKNASTYITKLFNN